MIEILIWVAGIVVYVGMAMFTAGYMAGQWAHERVREGYCDRDPGWYYDHPGIWFGGLCWPIILVYALFLKHLLNLGGAMAMKNGETRRVRIELEKKIRVEQERLQREAEEEIETELRKQRAA
jgi:hypothetical protein